MPDFQRVPSRPAWMVESALGLLHDVSGDVEQWAACSRRHENDVVEERILLWPQRVSCKFVVPRRQFAQIDGRWST